jgi:hypothetical protein
MPESPRHDDALAVLMQVRAEDRARAEMAEVEQLAEEEKQSQTGSLSDLASRGCATS